MQRPQSKLSILQNISQRRHYTDFLIKFGKLGLSPNYIDLLKTLVLTAPRRKHFYKFSTHRAIFRQWSANRFPEELTPASDLLPSIELLIVVAGKDLELLPFSLGSAIEKTKNPIHKTSLVVPFKDIDECRKILSNLKLTIETEIISEDTLISEEVRIKLRQKFKERYGWVLQQLVAVSFILNSKSEGVLLLDADTVLIKDVAWLESDQSQVLMVSLDYHEAYYKLLKKLIGSKRRPRTIHVTHHMLFQPVYLREIFAKFGLVSIDFLANWLIENANSNDGSPLCIEFELYAQGIIKMHPGKIKLRKFSNSSVPREEISDLNSIYKTGYQYNSISMHSYLDSA